MREPQGPCGSTLPDGPQRIEVELDRTHFPGGRTDFELEVEFPTEGPKETGREVLPEEVQRALIDWLAEGGIHPFEAASKTRALPSNLGKRSDPLDSVQLARRVWLACDGRPSGHARVPSLKSLALGVEGLAHAGTELEEREEQDVRDREAVTADEVLAVH